MRTEAPATMAFISTEGQVPAVLYLDLLERLLLRYGIGEEHLQVTGYNRTVKGLIGRLASHLLRRHGFALARMTSISPADRYSGKDWPPNAETMIGMERMRNIRACACDVLSNHIDGDFVEAGVWRGGATIYMRAILAAYGDENRRVWAFDSFQGVPKPSSRYRYAPDTSDELWTVGALGVSLETVRDNFMKYGLFDNRVCLVPGWFAESLPGADVERISLLRIDGDLYESTMDVLVNLYPKVAPGGFVIVDDYFHIAQCRAAVDDYRRTNGIRDDLRRVDWNAAYWQRAR